MSCVSTHRLIPSVLGAAFGAGGYVMATNYLSSVAASGEGMSMMCAERGITEAGGHLNQAAKRILERNSPFRDRKFVGAMLMIAVGLALVLTGVMINSSQTVMQNVSTVLSALVLLLVTIFSFASLTDKATNPVLCLQNSVGDKTIAAAMSLLAWLWVSASVGMYSSSAGAKVDHGKWGTAMLGGAATTAGLWMFASGRQAASGVAYGVGFLLVALAAAMVPSGSQCASGSLIQRWEKVLLGR